MPDDSRAGLVAALYRFFRSLKLALALILILIVLSVVATLIPQGHERAFYLVRYPVFGPVWTGLGFDSMFSSFVFLIPAALFFLNLLTCTVHRFVTRWRMAAKMRFGPDILHVGLLVLLAGALVTFWGRTEEMIRLRVGESTTVPGGFDLTLDDFRFERYEDGSPKDWLSIVTVTREGMQVKQGETIEVNSALRLGNLKLYQSGYGLDEGIVLADPDGNRYWLTAGNEIPLEEGRTLVLKGIMPLSDGTGNVALFDVRHGGSVTGQQTASTGTAVGHWVITEVVYAYFTELQVVRDPGYITVLVGLGLLTIGLFLTYAQKLGDNRV
jgi:cytochrome c biogenesis protein ResB